MDKDTLLFKIYKLSTSLQQLLGFLQDNMLYTNLLKTEINDLYTLNQLLKQTLKQKDYYMEKKLKKIYLIGKHATKVLITKIEHTLNSSVSSKSDKVIEDKPEDFLDLQ
jgi:hypothetical protein